MITWGSIRQKWKFTEKEFPYKNRYWRIGILTKIDTDKKVSLPKGTLRNDHDERGPYVKDLYEKPTIHH